MTVRVRFAPSPTGHLHVGGVRTALFNYLYAHHCGGRFLLRIEDTDRERSLPEYEQGILEGLRWLGLDWDEEPIRQSARVERHTAEALRLLEDGHAYRCRCTPEELEAMREAQKAAKVPMGYDRRCRDKNWPDDGKTPFTVRLKMPIEGQTVIHDPIKGDIVVENAELDDLIILRTDGTPTYNFAVVVDDCDMKITHVVRGDDHTTNTFKQINIYQALGYELPVFAHLPQVFGTDKKKLSKRHGATDILAYREMGYLPEALVNFLVRLGWAHGDQEVFTKQELIEFFDIKDVNASPAVFDPAKLEWLNGEYIRRKSLSELTDIFQAELLRRNLLRGNRILEPGFRPWLETLTASLQERSKTLVEMVEMSAFCLNEEVIYDEKIVKKEFKPYVRDVFNDVLHTLKMIGDKEPTADEWKTIIHDVMMHRDLNMKKVAQPLRIGVTGGTVSPPIDSVLVTLGKDCVRKRLQHALTLIPAE